MENYEQKVKFNYSKKRIENCKIILKFAELIGYL